MKIIRTLIILWIVTSCMACSKKSAVNTREIQSAEKIAGLEFTQSERDSMAGRLGNYIRKYNRIRGHGLINSDPPALDFNPLPLGFRLETRQDPLNFGLPDDVRVPENKEEIAFYTVERLSSLIRKKKISSEELTRIYLQRIRKYDSTLLSFITVTEDLALEQAERADREIAEGHYRGPLHGIPYGVKDLLALKDYRTTWGSGAHRDQVIDETAMVIKKLDQAGAVLLGKLSLGALAMMDVWFGGLTKNPWNITEGSSGSSAGPAAATAAGLVAFSIGSETWGSIVSPSTRCGVTGLRPTYGRVSRTGSMALSWSMDKIGPICRSANDCAIVFEAIRGTDGIDRTLVDAPFNYNAGENISEYRIGFIPENFSESSGDSLLQAALLTTIRKMGFNPVPVRLPEGFPLNSLSVILDAEAAAAFDDLTLSGRDDLLRMQKKNSWPNIFRSARFIPAVEYINANRIRYQLINEFYNLMQQVDIIVIPGEDDESSLMSNLTGNPVVVVPSGFRENGSPVSVTFIGRLFEEAKILRFAKAFQDITDFDEMHPPLFRP